MRRRKNVGWVRALVLPSSKDRPGRMGRGAHWLLRRRAAGGLGVHEQLLAAGNRLRAGAERAPGGLPGPGRRQRPDRRAGQAGNAARSGRRDGGHVHARPGRPASPGALGDLALRPRWPDQQGRHDRPCRGQPRRPGSGHPERGSQDADLHRAVRRRSAAERPAGRCGDREHHHGERRLPERAPRDRARACRLVLRVPALRVRRAPSAHLGAGGDRGGHLGHQRPHARHLDRELGARRSPSSWRSAWAWTTRCSSSAGTATACSPGRRPRTPPSPRSTLRAAPCCLPG